MCLDRVCYNKILQTHRICDVKKEINKHRPSHITTLKNVPKMGFVFLSLIAKKSKIVYCSNSLKVRVNVYSQEIREKLMTPFPLTQLT